MESLCPTREEIRMFLSEFSIKPAARQLSGNDYFLLVLTVILFLPIAAFSAVGGSISGTVKDSTGGVIPGAMVTITNASIRTEFKTVTDARGFFSFPNLAVGTWDLSLA